MSPAQALQPQIIPIQFTKLDTKTAPKLAQMGTLDELINGQMTQTGRLQTRPGYAPLPKNASFTTGRKLAPFGTELVALSKEQVWSFQPAGQSWSMPGFWSNIQPTVSTVVSNLDLPQAPDVAVGGGYVCYAYEVIRQPFTNDRDLKITIQDATTGVAVLQDSFLLTVTNVNTSNIATKVVYASGCFVLFYWTQSAGLNAIKIVPGPSPSVGSPISAIVNIATVGNALIYDVQARTDGKINVLFRGTDTSTTAGTQNVQARIWDPITMTAVGPGSITVSTQTGTTALGWLDSDFSDGFYWFATGRSNAGNSEVLVQALDENLTQKTADGNLLTGVALAGPIQVTGWVDSALGKRHVLCQFPGATSKTLNDLIVHGITGPTNSTMIRGVGLVSRAWQIGGLPHVVLAYDGFQVATLVNIQQTYFVMRPDTGAITARFMSNTGGGMRPSVCNLSSVPANGSTYVVAVQRKTQAAVENGGTVLTKALASVRFEYDASNLSVPRPLGGLLHMPGGTVRSYDTGTAHSLGFHVAPESVVLTDGGVGSLPAGTYSYVAVYCWLDRAGNIHRSAPSVATSLGLALNHKMSVAYAMYRFENKPKAFIEIYRANPGDTNYYKVTSLAAPIVNDPTVDSGTFSDSLDPAESIKREPLYTNGGGFQHDPPPPARVLGVHKDRVWLGGIDYANRIWPSLPSQPDQGTAFSGDLEIILDPADGEVTAIESLDDRVIIFCANAIYWVSGDGPNAIGQGDFSNPSRLAGSTGCTEPESIVRTEQGLLFRGQNAGGLYLLDRGMSLSYIGADVEAYNGLDISGGVNLADLNQVVFVSTDGTALVRDTYHQRWYAWYNHAAKAVCRYNNLLTFLAADGTVYQQTPGVYSDNGSPVQMYLSLTPISPFAVGGYGRLWELSLIGDFKGAHTIRVRLSYDNTNFFWEELRVDAAAAASSGVFGDATFGIGTFGGTSAGDYVFSVKPRYQRCSSVQISIDTVIADGTPSAGIDISALALRVGAQPGSLTRLPSSRSLVTQ